MMSAKQDEGVRLYNVALTFQPVILLLRGTGIEVCLFMFLPPSFIDSSRVYTPPDPPGYFDGHVWPMYLKNRQEMEDMVSGIGECPVKDAASSFLMASCYST